MQGRDSALSITQLQGRVAPAGIHILKLKTLNVIILKVSNYLLFPEKIKGMLELIQETHLGTEKYLGDYLFS